MVVWSPIKFIRHVVWSFSILDLIVLVERTILSDLIEDVDVDRQVLKCNWQFIITEVVVDLLKVFEEVSTCVLSYK